MVDKSWVVTGVQRVEIKLEFKERLVKSSMKEKLLVRYEREIVCTRTYN